MQENGEKEVCRFDFAQCNALNIPVKVYRFIYTLP